MGKDDFIRLIIEWNQNSPHYNNAVPGVEWNGERNIRYGNDDLWLDIQEYRNRNIIATHYEKKQSDGTVWGTDFVMNFNDMKMSVRLDRSYEANSLDSTPSFSTPYVITRLIDNGYIKHDNGLPVLKDAIEIDKDNLPLLADIVNGESHYKLPVVYISKTQYNKDPINVSALANKLKGIAHVLVQKDNKYKTVFRYACNSNNEYDGAIGIYYPTECRNHRKLFYRSIDGYDNKLFDRAFRSIVQFSNRFVYINEITGEEKVIWDIQGNG